MQRGNPRTVGVALLSLEWCLTEDGTPLWFALRFGPSTFGIFDAFPDEDARQAHLSGQVAGKVDVAALQPHLQ